jgi:hypothetical protein
MIDDKEIGGNDCYVSMSGNLDTDYGQLAFVEFNIGLVYFKGDK